MTQISSFFGLNTALSGLTAHQRALDVTGHNIGNVSTPGYSRQTVALVNGRPVTVEQGALQDGRGAQIGSGVDVAAYQRIRDGFLDLQYRAQQMRLGDSAMRSQALDQVEVHLGEPGDAGLAAQLDRFWSAWSDLSNSPESSAARTAVLEAGAQLARRIGEIDAGWAAVQAQAGTQLGQLMAASGPIQTMARQLAELNDAIHGATVAGLQPNDLLDRRDQLLDDLSRYGQVRVAADTARPGTVDVFFGDVGGSATPLVDGATRGTAAVASWPYTLPAAAGGEIGALQALSDITSGPIATLRGDLATFTTTLASTVNAAYTSNGTVAGNFFTFTSGAAASTLAVVPASATALRTGAGAAGDGSIARAVAGLRGGPGGADQAYAALVTRVGEQVRGARQDQASAQALAESTAARRASTSGVSLDEEMASLVRFQRGYQASARVMSTMDEMLDVLVNRTGRVGL